MLRSLAIRDIVLIDRLELSFAPGLSTLTGETGAGKSIVLDALGLALGGRGDRALVRGGAAQGSVTAAFEPGAGHLLWGLLAENGIPADGELILRRLVAEDGRSRAFVNDVPVSAGLLRQLGDQLVEVHGQFDQRGLLNPQTHRAVLDAFGGLDQPVAATRRRFAAWREAKERHADLQARLEAARAEEDYLRHRAQELADLDPQPGEEEALATRRQTLMSREKLMATLEEALAGLAGAGGAIERLGQVERRLERGSAPAAELLSPAVQALARALAETGEAEAALEGALRDIAGGEDRLEMVEERLFALRDAARKHRLPVDELPRLLAETRELLAAIDTSAEAVATAAGDVTATRAAFEAAARVLTEGRKAAAQRLAAAVEVELPPLKLERARFRVALEPVPEEEWGAEGAERIVFELSTNPGEPFGPLARIASGGELARLMLALKVVLARLDEAPTLVFDEVDSGIGGATADAVGERLARLARERQILVVTHAPQVAARADHHFSVHKRVMGARTVVEVKDLDPPARRDEVARMLAGAEITEAARAAADSLIAVGLRG